MFRKQNKSAFTLIELLVVIAIIGILATLAVVALQNARKNARDAKRIADIKQIQTALELYFNDAGEYPSEITSTIAYGSNIYMTSYPSAPNTPDGDCSEAQNTYSYQAIGADNDSYKISFCLGSPISSLSAGFKAATPAGIRDWACGDILTDSRDGNTYETVKIGTQCWMAKNLAYLPEVHNNTDFVSQGSASSPGYGVFNYDGSDVSTAKAETNYSLRGVLYNIYSVNQTGVDAICPDGWHVSTDNEWTILTDYLSANSEYWCGGNSAYTAKSLASISLWTSSDIFCAIGNDKNSNNSTGFNAVPTGRRSENDGSFFHVGGNFYVWTSTEYNASNYYSRVFVYSYENHRNWSYSKSAGLSVRCVRD